MSSLYTMTARPDNRDAGVSGEAAGVAGKGARALDTADSLDRFLAGVERKAWQIARIATGNGDEALDIVQDAMFKLVEKYRRKDPAEWTPLFYRILNSRINDWHRRNTVRNRFRVWFGRAGDEDTASDAVQELADPGGRTPEDETGSADAMQHLEAALHRLPARQQQAFLLRAYEGMDVAETAAAMGCSTGSVKTHYSRAVHTLREQLGDHWS